MSIEQAIQVYQPDCEQEEKDRKQMLEMLKSFPDIFLRDNKTAHFTASSWIVDQNRKHVLMAYHNIYQSWSWTGGHADGEKDLMSVAIREAEEETGIHAHPVTDQIYSLEILTVDGHIKREEYVSSHLHLNVTYLLEADRGENVRIKADENAAVQWFTLDEAIRCCSEKWMAEKIYQKLNQKLKKFTLPYIR